MDTDYEAILDRALARLNEVTKACEELEIEQAKLIQFIKATMNLLPEDRQKNLNEALVAVYQNRKLQNESLSGAIREALRADDRQWLTAAEVRDSLIQRGYDFSGYSSNPLASVSTTLKRLSDKDAEIESRLIEGVTAYRWKLASAKPTPSFDGQPRVSVKALMRQMAREEQREKEKK